MYKFVIPFYYLTYSRLRSPAEKLSLIWIYPMFLMVFLFGFYGVPFFPNIFSFLMAFVAWMSIYEIGYLENDAVTIKREENPNLRIPKEAIGFIQENFWKIVSIRLLIFTGILSALFFLNLWSTKQILYFVSIVILARLFFFLHNKIRSRWNILTYFFLCLSKYWVFPIIYLGLEYGIEPYLVILFSFPILRTIEHGVKPKYGLKNLQRWIASLDIFRVKYYGFVLVLSIVIYFGLEFTKILIYCITYFFLFRLGILMLIYTGKYSRESIS